MTNNSSQSTDIVLMVRPSQFGFNSETAETNIFQQETFPIDQLSIHQKALKEFDDFIKILRDHKIYVIVLQDSLNAEAPDSLFPNNWISFHKDTMILYPMLAKNRRRERRPDWIRFLKNIFHVDRIIDLSANENEYRFLEGTGSMVFDHRNKIVYANLSSRTNESILKEVAAELSYEAVSFKAETGAGKEIYHTNVLMAIGETTAVICSEVIHKEERKNVLQQLAADHRLVEISEDQMKQFAGNMLLVRNRDHEKFWVMSRRAFESLNPFQKEILNGDGDFIFSDLDTIESVGGGSARCMMAEVFQNE